MSPLKLIVGLGNPSPDYDHTRHNVGALWVRQLASRFGITLQPESKFKGEIGRGTFSGVDVRLLVPLTYMNLSGESVSAVARFYKIPTSEILVVYDEMAFDAGVLRLKQGGGDNGHNGLKNIRALCGNDGSFNRLRIGVGHPGDKNLVTAYLTQRKMPQEQRQVMEQAWDLSDSLLGAILNSDWQTAMTQLHTADGPSVNQGQQDGI
ncbi:MAG: aminoacyl-tRNA hydrolase [Pseudomonadota bacterium]